MLKEKKEIDRKLNQALKIFKETIELARKNMIVGSYIVNGPEKKVRKKRTPKIANPEPSAPEPKVKRHRTKKGDRAPIQRVPDSELPNMD